MLLSRINLNPSTMSSTVLRAQYIKPRTEQSVENKAGYFKTNEEATKSTNFARILPTNDVNVMYVASAFHSFPPTERPRKSIWA